MAEDKLFIFSATSRYSSFESVIYAVSIEEAFEKFIKRYKNEAFLEIQFKQLEFNVDGIADVSFGD